MKMNEALYILEHAEDEPYEDKILNEACKMVAKDYKRLDKQTDYLRSEVSFYAHLKDKADRKIATLGLIYSLSLFTIAIINLIFR